jgi:hypothetical protein
MNASDSSAAKDFERLIIPPRNSTGQGPPLAVGKAFHLNWKKALPISNYFQKFCP